MTSSVDQRAAFSFGLGVLRDVGAGLVVGCIAIVFSLGFATVIFSGGLVDFRQEGTTLILTGSFVFALSALLFGGPHRLWWANQTAPIVLMAVGVAAVQQAMEGAAPEALFATACTVVAAATLLSGLVMSALGLARVAHLAKFVPYPVVGGFLSATGVFLVYRAAILPLGPGAEFADLFAPANIPGWLPFILLAALISLSDRWVSSGAVLLSIIAIYLLGLAVSGGFDLTRDGGTVAGVPEGSGWLPQFPSLLDRFAAADLAVVGSLWPILLAIPALACLGLVMSASAIELTIDRGTDLNREMRTAGAANIVSGLLGGPVGHVSASMNGLADDIAPQRSRLFALSASALIAVALLTGARLIGAVPPGLLETVLAYAGFQVLARWLIAGFREMPKGDFAILLAILAAALLTDFTVAIAIGMLAAVLRFTLAYSRIDVVRSGATGKVRLSPTERSERDVETILSRGHETAAYELQGFLFFGTANALYERIVTDIEAASPRRRNLIIDFRRVDGMDVSAAFVFRRLLRVARLHGVRTLYSGLDAKCAAMLERTRASAGAVILPSIGDALCLVEEEVLSNAAGRDSDAGSRIGHLISEFDELGLPVAEPLERLASGDVVFSQGAPADCLVYLVSGRLAATVGAPENGDARRVATFLPGSIAGEIGFVTGSRRTATVIAEIDSVIRRVSVDSLQALESTRPDLAARFHALIAELLARRLDRTTALYVSLDG